MTVHDSVLVEIEKDRAEEAAVYISNLMEELATGYFPEVTWKADADIGDRWYEDPPDLSKDKDVLEREFAEKMAQHH